MKRVSKIRIIYIWMITYMIILLLPVCANFMLYNNFAAKFEKEITDYNVLLAERVATEYDKKIVNHMNFVITLEKDSYLREVAAYGKALNKEQQRKITDFVKERIKLYYGQYPQDFYIYLKKSGMVIKPENMAKSDIAYDVWAKEYDEDYSSWMSLMEENHRFEYKWDNDYHLYSYHTLFAGTESEATMFSLVTDKTILDFEKSFFDKDGRKLIICDNVNSVPIELDGIKHELNLSQLVGEYGELNLEDNFKESFTGIYRKSSATDKTYVIMMENEFFKSVQDKMYDVSALTALICLVIGAIFASLFTYYNYAPLRKIIKSVGGKTKENEYEYLGNIIDNMNSAHKHYSEERILFEFLNNTRVKESSVKWFEEKNRINEQTSTLVAVVFFQNTSAAITESNYEKDYEALCYATSNLFSELLEQIGCRVHSIMMQGALKLIICTENTEDISNAARSFEKIMKDELNVICCVAIGDGCQSVKKIALSHRHALGVLDYMLFMNESGGIGSYDDKISRSIEKNARKNIKEMVLYIINNEFGKLRTAFDTMLMTDTEKPELSEFRNVLKNITDEVLRLLTEQSKNHTLIKADSVELTNCSSFDEYFERFKGTVDVSIENGRKVENTFFAQICAYVDENICNPDLTNGKIAAYFKISEVYLSRFFKSNYPEGLLKYITKKRIDIAKKILLESDKTVDDTAVEAGFSNSLMLLRSFKKYEGVTPTQYRELYKN